MATHGSELTRQYCNSALVLDNGRGRVFHDVDFAAQIYETL
jgi:ABC-type polysaccharide/polyol phosphate transport system ATPase subunit